MTVDLGVCGLRCGQRLKNNCPKAAGSWLAPKINPSANCNRHCSERHVSGGSGDVIPSFGWKNSLPSRRVSAVNAASFQRREKSGVKGPFSTRPAVQHPLLHGGGGDTFTPSIKRSLPVRSVGVWSYDEAARHSRQRPVCVEPSNKRSVHSCANFMCHQSHRKTIAHYYRHKHYRTGSRRVGGSRSRAHDGSCS